MRRNAYVLVRQKFIRSKSRIVRGGNFGIDARILVFVTRNNNRYDFILCNSRHADKLLRRLHEGQTEFILRVICGGGRRYAYERSDRILLAGLDNFYFPLDTRRLETFAENELAERRAACFRNCRDNFFGVHNFLRATVSEHPKFDVWYYYTVVFLLGFLPWNLPVLYAQFKKFWRERKLPTFDVKEKFLLTWALTVPIVFQCFATKYVTYTLPYMLPIAILFAGFFVKREKIFYRMAAVTSIILIAATFISIRVCNDFSGKEISQILPKYVDEDTRIVSYRRLYSYSLVYYTGFKIWRIENPEYLHRIRPEKMKWTSLNVMPIMSTAELKDDEKVVAIVDTGETKKFFKAIKGDWTLIDETDNVKIYRRN